MTVTLLENFRAVFYTPFYAAFALGAYADQGVDVRLKSSSEPPQHANALVSGEGQVSWGGPMRVMRAYDQDPECGLVIFCEVVRRDPFFLIGREPLKKFRFSSLIGKKIGTVCEVPTPWMCLQHDLRLAGIDPESLDRISDWSMAENANALRAGEMDVIQVFQPLVEELLMEGAGHIWVAAASRGLRTYTAFYTTREFMENDPDSLLDMTRAMHRTLQWIATHDGKEIAECVADYFPDLSENTLAKAVDRYQRLGIWNKSPVLAREGYQRLQSALLSGGLIKKGYPYEAAVDMRFAEIAVKD